MAQQILSILSALSQKLTNFVFDGKQISLVHTCGLFITMNPGYAGRTELPDNLKSMFRPISMMVPDSSMIAEINLFGEGFQNSRVLAKKVSCTPIQEANIFHGVSMFFSPFLPSRHSKRNAKLLKWVNDHNSSVSSQQILNKQKKPLTDSYSPSKNELEK